MSYEEFLNENEILIEQWNVLINLFNTQFMDFINQKISKYDKDYKLFEELSKTSSAKNIIDIMNQLCDGLNGLKLEQKKSLLYDDIIGKKIKLMFDLVDMFGPEYVYDNNQYHHQLENIEDIYAYYIRRNHLIIMQWKEKIYNQIDDKFGNGKYKETFPESFRKFPLASNTKIPF